MSIRTSLLAPSASRVAAGQPELREKREALSLGGRLAVFSAQKYLDLLSTVVYAPSPRT
jgi:hypothetical protein